ncbi:N-acetyltransferase [Oleomonas cavernae]|uniref:N-acetyltransferase n=1 Tax=Oleomonas cavernae TaxID=2320859 RepID=A0A418WT68_9PROT|nr:GNAT family N-acetyltransferase [Oleomonas cavernae]RJF94440.1 N-acetyltransferase [Oleomonas cavernae]
MSALPRFETKRLLLRQRTLDDLEASIAMDQDPLVVQYVAVPWSDPQSHRAFVLDRTTRAYPTGLGYWSVFPREDPDTFIGWVLLIPNKAVGPEIEIGWRFVRSSWGKGYASEAARPILDYGLQILGLPEIVAEIDARNHASIGVARNIGMRFTGWYMLNGIRGERYVAS